MYNPLEALSLIFQDKNCNLNQEANPQPSAFRAAVQTTTTRVQNLFLVLSCDWAEVNYFISEFHTLFID